MKRIILLLLIFLIISGCSPKIKSMREEERDFIKKYKHIAIDPLGPSSNETAVNDALRFCYELLPDSMEECYLDVAKRIMPDQLDRAIQVCNATERFEYTRWKNQALCFAELAMYKETNEEMLAMCDLIERKETRYQCYSDVNTLLVEKNRPEAVKEAMERCGQFEYGRDKCFSEFVYDLAKNSEGHEEEIFEMCMMSSGLNCLNKTGTLHMAVNERIYRVCKEDPECLARAGRILVVRGMLESALEICDAISPAVLFSPHDSCILNVALHMTDPEKITQTCWKIAWIKPPAEDRTECARHAAVTYARQGDLRAVDMDNLRQCKCTEEVLGILAEQDKNLALKACEKMRIDVERCKGEVNAG